MTHPAPQRSVRALAESLLVIPLAFVWRHQGHSRWLRAVASTLALPWRDRAGRILAGTGRGLLIDPTGGAASYRIGLVEWSVQRALAAHLRTGMVFYDVGAAIGFHTLLAAKLVGPTGTVIAFEPAEDLAQQLRHNAALNGFRQVRLVPFALGADDREGIVTVRIAGSSQATATQTARMRRLDGVVEELGLPPPNLIKIDVEGGERDVLFGARATLHAWRPVIIVETHGTDDVVRAHLSEAGYRCESLTRTRAAQQHVLGLPDAPTRAGPADRPVGDPP